MAYCRMCGQMIDDSATFCQHCGAPQNAGSVSKGKETDKKSFWWGLLGFFIPIVGLILYIVWKKDTPKKAGSAGKGALISVILYVVVAIASVIMITAISNEDATDRIDAAVESEMSDLTPMDVITTDDSEAIAENTDDRFTYRNDGQIDTFNDGEIVWTYEYNPAGVFERRIGVIEYPDWEYGEEETFHGTTTDFTVSPSVFAEKYDNCLGFSISYLMTNATGTPGGETSVFVKEPPERLYVKEATVNVIPEEWLDVTLDFDVPKTVTAVALRPVYGTGSWSSRMIIYNLRVVDYEYVTG